MVGRGQREQAHLGKAGGRQPALHHLAHTGDRALADRPGDHPGLTEAAAPGAAPEDLHAHPLVDRFGKRHQRLLGIGPLVEVHDRVFGDPPGHPGFGGGHPADPAVGQVAHVIEARHIDIAALGQTAQQFTAAARSPGPLPVRDDVGDLQDGLLAVTDNGGVDEVGNGFGVEGRMATDDDQGLRLTSIGGVQRDAGQIEGVEEVGVPELGGKGDTEDIEVAHRAMTVDAQLRQGRGAHQRLHVGPHRIRPLGQRIGALVEDLIQDHDALVGQPHLIGVGVHQHPADAQFLALGAEASAVPVLHGGIELAADILDRFAHPLEQRLEVGESGLARHPIRVRRVRPRTQCTSQRARGEPPAPRENPGRSRGFLVCCQEIRPARIRRSARPVPSCNAR